MTNFLIGRAYRDYLSAMGFCVEQVLKKAGLPEDLFARQVPCLGAEEYFRFLQAIEALSPDKDAPVRLASSGLVSQISPPVFAASCSPDARTCLRRLAQYKPLIGALFIAAKRPRRSSAWSSYPPARGWSFRRSSSGSSSFSSSG